MSSAPSIRLLGVPIDVLTLDAAASRIATEAAEGRGGWVVTPNLDILRRARRDSGFRSLYDATTMKLADGMPLVWASRIRGTPLPERAAGSDLIWKLAEHAARTGASIYLLGGNPGSADRCAQELVTRYPKLKIAGLECPPLGFDNNDSSMDQMIDRISATSPGIVLVALGCPKQERVIARMRPKLTSAWFVGVGITFSFVAGDVRRAPMWMRKLGLEWVHRLVQEPRRLAKRYLVDGIPFAFVLLTRSAMDRVVGHGRASAAEGSA